MKPYLMQRSTGYKSISQKENIDFKYLMKTGGHLTGDDALVIKSCAVRRFKSLFKYSLE